MPKNKNKNAKKNGNKEDDVEDPAVLKEEANKIRDLLQNMSKNIQPGSKWFVIA